MAGKDKPSFGTNKINTFPRRMSCVKCQSKNKNSLIENGTDIHLTAVFDDCDCKLDIEPYESKTKKSCCRRPSCQTVWGVFLVLLSILGFIFPLRDIMLWEKLNMRQSLPLYNWWTDPPDTVKVRVYIFNVTNHERFMSGVDNKMHMKEIGPVVYMETVRHTDVRFHENGTMTYVARRTLTFLQEETIYKLNDTIIVPNMAMLGVVSMLHDRYFYRTGFNFILNLHTKKFFLKMTIQDYLWDFTDTILNSTKLVSPSMVPVINVGVLNRTFEQFLSEITVKYGPRWGHKDFFRIQSVKDIPDITGYAGNQCMDNVTGSSDGILYHQDISKNDVLYNFYRPMCSLLPLQFSEEMTVNGMRVFKFTFLDSTFDRVPKNVSNCREDSNLPSGIKDSSKCYYDFPLVLSFPHFYLADIPKDAYVTGLQPDPIKHSMGFVLIEPLTGTPIRSDVKIQCNLQMNNIKGLYSKEFDKFSDMIIPIVWVETDQERLPTKVFATLYFTVVIVPVLMPLIYSIVIVIGSLLIFKHVNFQHKVKKYVLSKMLFSDKNAVKNKIHEMEVFLNKPDEEK